MVSPKYPSIRSNESSIFHPQYSSLWTGSLNLCDTHPKPFHGPGCIYGDKLRYTIYPRDILVQLKYQISHK